MPLVDSHCHLQDEKFDDDRAEVLARSLDILDWIVVIGDDRIKKRKRGYLKPTTKEIGRRGRYPKGKCIRVGGSN